jgi:hypothetical protein
MNNDENYFAVNKDDLNEYLLLLLKCFRANLTDDLCAVVSIEEVARLKFLEHTVNPQGPPFPKDGEINGWQVLQEVQEKLGIDWYEELTRLVTPWSKFAKYENQPIFYAYWSTKEGKHLSLWQSSDVIKTLFEKRAIYLAVSRGLEEYEANLQAQEEFNTFKFGLEEKHCKFCGQLFHPAHNLYGVKSVYFYLQRKTCSVVCSEAIQWQRSMQLGMHPDAEFDKSIVWEAVWDRFGPYCYICGKESIYNQEDLGIRQGTKAWKTRWGDYVRGDADRNAVVEHVIPRSNGGPHTWDNVRIACNKCNLIKGDKLPPPTK